MTALPTCIPSYYFPFMVRRKRSLSGISGYDLQVRTGLDGQWTDLLTDTILTSTNYNIVPGITYYFRLRAKDLAGNIEDWPAKYNTFTSVDFTKPASSMTALPATSSTSIALTWSGFDALSGVSGYDLQVRVGAGGQWTDVLVNTPATNTTFNGTEYTLLLSCPRQGRGGQCGGLAA